jgi:hypothetical protein
MKAILSVLLVFTLLATSTLPASAAVNVERSGSENPVVEVARSTAYGGLAGLLLGGAIALANDGKNGGDIVRWGFVAGTFFGFGYGLYHVTSRPRARALLEVEQGKLLVARPDLVIEPGRSARVVLVEARF